MSIQLYIFRYADILLIVGWLIYGYYTDKYI